MNTNQNMLIAFLQENIQRLFTKSPLFFKWWQIITILLMAITGVPEALLYFGVVLPPDIAFFANKIIAAAALGALLMSKLTTQSKAVGVSEIGTVLKTTDKQLPFTLQAEQKAADKLEVQKVELIAPSK
jgi:hypothetical protein